MISKNDIVLLLTELNDQDINTTQMIKSVYSTPNIPLEVLKFINNRRQLDLTAFYKKIRKSYNEKRSKLYISLVRDSLDPSEVLTTLASYGLQVALFASKLPDNQMFLKHARAREVNLVLTKYYTDYDLTGCINLLKLIKADLMACEMVEGRRAS